jgi:hypothetical protein
VQVGTGKIGAAQVSVGPGRPWKPGSAQCRVPYLRLPKVATVAGRFREVGMVEDNIREFGTIKMGTAQAGSFEVRRIEVGIA